MLRITRFDPTSKTCIKCRICGDTKTYEKECWDCDITKPIDAFSGKQRVMDEGNCRRCMEVRERPEPYYPEFEGMEAPEDNNDDTGVGEFEGEGGTAVSSKGSVI